MVEPLPDHRKVPFYRWPSGEGCPGSRTIDGSVLHSNEPTKTKIIFERKKEIRKTLQRQLQNEQIDWF